MGGWGSNAMNDNGKHGYSMFCPPWGCLMGDPFPNENSYHWKSKQLTFGSRT
jgi:hypothetical protein